MGARVERLRASLIGTPSGTLLNLVGFVVVAVVAIATVQRVYQGGGTYFFQTIGFGLAQGAIFALVALGYTMVYGIIELINFAHGDVFTLAAYIGAALIGFFATSENAFSIGNVIALLVVFPVVMLIMGAINVGI